MLLVRLFGRGSCRSGGGGEGGLAFLFLFLFLSVGVAFCLLDVGHASVDSVPPADSTHRHASHTTLSGPNELIWSNRGSFPACRLRKVPRMPASLVETIPGCPITMRDWMALWRRAQRGLRRSKWMPTRQSTLKMRCHLCFHAPVGHLHDVRRIDNRRTIVGLCTFFVPRYSTRVAAAPAWSRTAGFGERTEAIDRIDLGSSGLGELSGLTTRGTGKNLEGLGGTGGDWEVTLRKQLRMNKGCYGMSS